MIKPQKYENIINQHTKYKIKWDKLTFLYYNYYFIYIIAFNIQYNHKCYMRIEIKEDIIFIHFQIFILY
jgi:hypothetical protein